MSPIAPGRQNFSPLLVVILMDVARSAPQNMVRSMFQLEGKFDERVQIVESLGIIIESNFVAPRATAPVHLRFTAFHALQIYRPTFRIKVVNHHEESSPRRDSEGETMTRLNRV